MLANLTRNWWVFLLRGVCALILAVVAFTQPVATVLTLIIVWGAFALCDGLSALWSGWSDRPQRRGGLWPFFVTGLVSVAAGVIALVAPGVTLFVLLAIIGITSIARGLFEMFAAIRLRRIIRREWFLAVAGLVSVLFGVLLLSRPEIGLLTLVYFIGAYAFVSGILLAVVAFKLRGLRDLAEL